MGWLEWHLVELWLWTFPRLLNCSLVLPWYWAAALSTTPSQLPDRGCECRCRGCIQGDLCEALYTKYYVQGYLCKTLNAGCYVRYKVSWYRCCGVLCRVLCARFWIQALCTVCRAVLLSEADPYIRCIQCIFYFGEFVRRGSCCV